MQSSSMCLRNLSIDCGNCSGVAIILPPYKIQNPSEPQNTPRNTPQIPFQNRNMEKIRKIYENHPISYIFRIFFLYFGFGRDLGCISGCILGFRGVLYFVWGTYDRNSGAPNLYNLSEKYWQYTSNLYRSTPPICNAVPCWLLSSGERETPQYTSKLYRSTPPILYRSTPPICTGDTFEKIPGLGVRE